MWQISWPKKRANPKKYVGLPLSCILWVPPWRPGLELRVNNPAFYNKVVSLCYGTWDKPQPDWPLGVKADNFSGAIQTLRKAKEKNATVPWDDRRQCQYWEGRHPLKLNEEVQSPSWFQHLLAEVSFLSPRKGKGLLWMKRWSFYIMPIGSVIPSITVECVIPENNHTLPKEDPSLERGRGVLKTKIL